MANWRRGEPMDNNSEVLFQISGQGGMPARTGLWNANFLTCGSVCSERIIVLGFSL